jgi:hypothetical protein
MASWGSEEAGRDWARELESESFGALSADRKHSSRGVKSSQRYGTGWGDLDHSRCSSGEWVQQSKLVGTGRVLKASLALSSGQHVLAVVFKDACLWIAEQCSSVVFTRSASERWEHSRGDVLTRRSTESFTQEVASYHAH